MCFFMVLVKLLSCMKRFGGKVNAYFSSNLALMVSMDCLCLCIGIINTQLEGYIMF